MTGKHTSTRRVGCRWLVLILTLGASLNAFAFFGLGGDSWKEEVLLHDGSTLVAERSQSYGGRREPGQSAPVREQEIVFTLPGTDTRLSFKSEYSEDIGRANLFLLALHILNGTPYIVAEPNLCLAYNKWGRPNPPYVIFKHDGTAWQRIPLQELPAEFKEINLVIETKGNARRLLAEPVVSAELVRTLNGTLGQPEYKGILREPITPGRTSSSVNCEEMVRYKCGWGSPGEFNRKYFENTCK